MTSQPPPENPFLSAYESFYNNTPLVTRMVFTSITTTYLISWFYDPSLMIANIPGLTIGKFQLYRIVISPFTCNQLLSLIFAYLSFVTSGNKIENLIGSTNFGALLLSFGIIINVIHILICGLLFVVTRNPMWLMQPSYGVWMLILAVIAAECAPADPSSKRRFFFMEVPTRFYPCVLLVFFALFSGGSIPIFYVVSIGVGYLYGFGKLDFIRIKGERRKQMEAGVLRKFTTRHGFVQGPTGGDWNFVDVESAPQPVSNNGNGTNASGQSGWAPTVFRSPDNSSSNTASRPTPAFGGSAGQKLGSSSSSSTRSRPSASSNNVRPDREAMLAAAERRALLASSRQSNDEAKEV
ncbi:hypothetical protein CTEN210_09286 [Chaetoceros tenuissimus]|uniref:Peptidase S54 rhomboid domain-containing protein n=1 Tax=Chaetoceros tenuissimus TaxID=426638 RepID=A0AAD3CXL6_9STRA|nr:hypothetical protein CTEN210_09286 [Chaetoceros tenuissimus]